MKALALKLRHILHQDDFWHGPRHISPFFVPGTLQGYPTDLRAKTQPFAGPVSELGVPLFAIGPADALWLHPVTVCQVALGWYERWLAEGDAAFRAQFLTLADWLIANQQPWAGGGAWPVPTNMGLYQLRGPWVSALVQGQALSVLARAAQIAPEKKGAAMRAMEAALTLFELDVRHGGVRVEDEFGVAFEEYPSPTPSIVLNGLISALWGLADVAILQAEGPAQAAFQAGVEALLRRLHRYDVGFWSRYCLFAHPIPNVASPYYHREHLAQLQAMMRLAPDARWQERHDQWQRYHQNPACRAAAIFSKGLFRLTVYPVTRSSV